jgi:hypothetical protein
LRPHPTTTGLPPHQFDNLVQRVRQHDTANQFDNPFPRPPSVCVETAVLMTVLATRHNLVQTVLAAIFAVSQPTVSRVLAWGRRVLPTLIEPAVVTIDDVGPHEQVVADGTLTPTGNRAGHDGLYSGKRHAAGVGLQVVSDRWGRLIDVAGPVPGATHDARAWFDLGLHERLADRVVLTDLGYLGCSDDATGCTVTTPIRKPRGEDLSWGQRISNHAHNSARAPVERAIAQLKKWRVLSTGYRGPLSRIRDAIRTAVALEKLRTHPWPL